MATIPTQRLVDDWSSGFRIDVTSQFHGHSELSVGKCNDCGLKYFAPLNTAGNGELYEQLEQLHSWYYMPWKWEHDVAIQRLKPGQRILEIGSAEGAFLNRLRNDFHLDAEGVELNKYAAAKARLSGIPVHVADVLDVARERPESYDVVCSFQVLEHVPNPGQFVEAAARLLRPGGLLLLGVPNQESFLGRQWNVLDMPPHHMSQWTPHVFKSLERVFPLQLTAVECEPLASYHVKGYVTTYAKYYGRRSTWQRILWNKLTRRAIRTVLQAGVRRWVRGQSLFAELRRLEGDVRVQRSLAA